MHISRRKFEEAVAGVLEKTSSGTDSPTGASDTLAGASRSADRLQHQKPKALALKTPTLRRKNQSGDSAEPSDEPQAFTVSYSFSVLSRTRKRPAVYEWRVTVFSNAR
jgi:hypothetical protein